MDNKAALEQLAAENRALRTALEDTPTDRELQAAMLISVALDNLTKIGPHTTARVLTWAFARYGISETIYSGQIRDRRTKEVSPVSLPQPVEPPMECPKCDRRFSGPKALGPHMMRAHQVRMKDSFAS
jgi:hypothetical protein